MQYQEVILEPLLEGQTMPKKWRNTNSTPPHASQCLGVRNAALVVIVSHEGLMYVYFFNYIDCTIHYLRFVHVVFLVIFKNISHFTLLLLTA